MNQESRVELCRHVVPEILFPGPVLEHTAVAETDQIVDAGKLASSKHPHLLAEIWQNDRKVAVCRPCCSMAHELGRTG
jgi:hypothetical protein